MAIVDKRVRAAKEAGRSLEEAAHKAADKFDEEIRREKKEKGRRAYQRRKDMKTETPGERFLRLRQEKLDKWAEEFYSRLEDRWGKDTAYDPQVEEIAEAIRITRATGRTLEEYWEAGRNFKEVMRRSRQDADEG